ncbi:MAG: ATP synthase subunit C [Candidatus Freyarchaeota archaeon]
MNKKFLLLLLAVALVLTVALHNSFVLAQYETLDLSPFAKYTVGIGAGLAVGLAGLGAGLGMGTASAAAIGAISEKPEVFGRSIIYIVLIEAIAIYGFVISFLLLGKIV